MNETLSKSQKKEDSTMGTTSGNLENIAKLSHQKSNDGSRMSSVSSTYSRRKLEPTGSMEAQTPELTSKDYQDYNLEIPFDDYETDSDLNSEECWDSQDEANTDREIDRNDDQPTGYTAHQPVAHQTREIVPVQGDDDIEVDSEEERDIMKEIRSEIQNQLREDLKDEIEVYHKKLQFLEWEAEGNKGDCPDEESATKPDMDPKLKAAILKMKKLDKILTKKVKREKEVKRERLLLQKRLREELEQIKPEGRDDTREVKANMEKFLMLALPPSHNEGVDIEEGRSQSPVTPVFHTQLNENEFDDRAQDKKKSSGRSDVREGSSAQSSAGSTRSGLNRQNEEDDEKLKKKKTKSKDFIKRNKQLAGDADNPIPMTDEEKKRITDLLGDLDEITDIPEAELDPNLSTAWVSENPFQISVHSGEGYLPEPEDRSILQRIDSQLKVLLPEEEFTSLCRSEYTPDSQRLASTRATVLHGTEVEFDRLGEKALQEKRDERDLQTRLRRIEEELSRLKHPNEDIEIATPRLHDDTLQDLIDQCVRSLSQTTITTSQYGFITPHSDYPSSRLSLLENPPRLDEDVLQRLLSEARDCMDSSRLTTDRDSINDVRNHGFNKELGIEPISQQTWDVILSHNAPDSDEETPIPVANYGIQYDRISDVFEENTIQNSRTINHHNREYNNLYQSDDLASNSLEENLQKLRSDTPLSIYSYRESDNYDDNSRAPSGRLSRTPFLPEINQSPCLVSQGAAGSVVRSAQSDRRAAFRGQTTRSIETAESLPRPPTSERPQNSQNSRSRPVMSPPKSS